MSCLLDEAMKDLYHNYTYQGGGPNIPLTTILKVLFLQSMFNMVDEQAGKEIRDHISFMNFLDYPDHLPGCKDNMVLHGETIKDP